MVVNYKNGEDDCSNFKGEFKLGSIAKCKISMPDQQRLMVKRVTVNSLRILKIDLRAMYEVEVDIYPAR